MAAKRARPTNWGEVRSRLPNTRLACRCNGYSEEHLGVHVANVGIVSAALAVDASHGQVDGGSTATVSNDSASGGHDEGFATLRGLVQPVGIAAPTDRRYGLR